MQLIKDKQIINDAWEYKADDAELGDGNVTVSVARLQRSGNRCDQP